MAVTIAIAMTVVFHFRRCITIAYHERCLFEAGRDFAAYQATKRTLFQEIRVKLFRIHSPALEEKMELHEEALIALGHLHKYEFYFTNRFWVGTNRLYFYQTMTNTLVDSRSWWLCSYSGSNKIVVTATANDFPKWKKLVADFDR